MAELLRLPPRDLDAACRAGRTARAGHACDVVDLTRRDIFNVDPRNVRDVVTDITRLPNWRDRNAAVAALVRDYRRTAKKRHGVSGPPLDGACRAIEARIRRAIRDDMEKRE